MRTPVDERHLWRSPYGRTEVRPVSLVVKRSTTERSEGERRRKATTARRAKAAGLSNPSLSAKYKEAPLAGAFFIFRGERQEYLIVIKRVYTCLLAVPPTLVSPNIVGKIYIFSFMEKSVKNSISVSVTSDSGINYASL
jgi:hypothetical protein